MWAGVWVGIEAHTTADSQEGVSCRIECGAVGEEAFEHGRLEHVWVVEASHVLDRPFI